MKGIEKAGSPSRTRTSDPMINSHAPWVNRVKLQQIRITIQSPDLYSQLLKNKPVYVVCEVRERLVKSHLTS